MPMVQLSESLFARAQSHATPLVDDLESVISRAFDALDKLQKTQKDGEFTEDSPEARKPNIQSFDPGNPPNLAHSQPMSIKVDGEAIPYGQLYWNTLMYTIIEKAVAAGYIGEKLQELMVVPTAFGTKTNHGYKPLEKAGISVQGQDSNGAWKQTYHLAKQLDLKLEVVWCWQINQKAALPGQRGSFTVG